MNTEYINILNNKENSKQEIDDIHFRKAIDNEEFSCFRQSGSERILNYLKQELGNDIPMLIDFSALPSSFGKNGKMADFMTIYDPFPKAFIDELDKAYHTVYNYLGIKGENLGMFYKKNFFYEPHTASYYFSEESKGGSKVVKNINSGDEKKWLEKDNIYFKNYSFELSYKQFERNLELKKGSDINCQERNDILLGLYDKYFTNSKKGLLLSVPLIGFPSRSNNCQSSLEQQRCYEGLGAIFVYFITDIKPTPDKIRKVANGLWFLGLQITYNSMFQIAYELAENTQKEAIKSAIAALMARNMSHNLGSHYLTNTKNYFRNTVEKVISEQLNPTIMGADYRGNARLLQYIQERMDFIATIISGDQYPLGSLNFKAEFFDVLTNDDCGERHSDADSPKYEKNFLLQYLLFSERYTRHGHTCDMPSDNMGDVELQIILNDEVYTGLKNLKDQEEPLKMELSKLRLALPGGIMARHALFTLLENILRNAAKHSKHKEKLILTIKIEKTDENKYKLCFYDNCESANRETDIVKKDGNGNDIIKDDGEKQKKTVKEVISEKLSNITIIGEDGKIDKYNKGLKEMLICALWLQNENVAQTLYDIQTKKKDGIECLKVDEENGNLCYKIDLPLWEKITEIKEEDNMPTNKFLAIHADYIVATDDFSVEKNGEGFKITQTTKEKEARPLSKIFPRFRSGYNESEEAKLIEEIKNEANQYTILINHPSKDIKYENSSVINIHDHDASPEQLEMYKESQNIIVFFDHYLNGGIEETQKKLDAFPNALYVDSISGENFTSTLVSPDFLEDDILRMKVIDSAKTKIVVLDERVWADYRSKWNGSIGKTDDGLSDQLSAIYDKIKDRKEKLEANDWNSLKANFEKGYVWLDNQLTDKEGNELELAKKFLKKYLEKWRLANDGSFAQLLMEKKNVFIYTMREDYLDNGRESFLDLSKHTFSASDFKCKFLTVHLGLIEKYLEHNEKKSIEDFIELIKKCFHPSFISIHSGRGNFSPELEKGLEAYPFITLSALDAALGNSKYLLSELFHNTNFIGKGETNN